MIRNFSLKPETIEKIEKLAKKLDRKKSNIIDLAVAKYYKEVEEGEQCLKW